MESPIKMSNEELTNRIREITEDAMNENQPKVGQVLSEMARQGEMLAELTKITRELQERLKPVTIEMPRPQPTDNERPAMCPLAEQINQHNATIADLIELVNLLWRGNEL